MVCDSSKREVRVTQSVGSSMTSEDGFSHDHRTKSRKAPRRAGLLSSLRTSRGRLASALLALSIAAVVAVTIVPVGNTTAFPTREGGGCSGCHTGAQTAAMLTVAGLPVGSYTPGLDYTITITITDTNGATGENNFDIIASGGTFSTTDPNAEVNTPATGAEASANDAVSPMTATSWTVVWTAPSSGSMQIDIWAVMGDGAVGTLDIWDLETYTYNAIPEFFMVLIPIIGVLAIVVVVSRIRKG